MRYFVFERFDEQVFLFALDLFRRGEIDEGRRISFVWEKLFDDKLLLLRDQRDRCPFIAYTTCSSNAVRVASRGVGEVVVEYVGDVGHVDPSSGDIRCDQDLAGRFAETAR